MGEVLPEFRDELWQNPKKEGNRLNESIQLNHDFIALNVKLMRNNFLKISWKSNEWWPTLTNHENCFVGECKTSQVVQA